MRIANQHFVRRWCVISNRVDKLGCGPILIVLRGPELGERRAGAAVWDVDGTYNNGCERRSRAWREESRGCPVPRCGMWMEHTTTAVSGGAELAERRAGGARCRGVGCG
jgi:hypothetical protein